MNKLVKTLFAFLATLTCVILISSPVKAANGMPSKEEVLLMKRIEMQKAENEKIKEYIKLQNDRAKAEKRKVSDIEMVKRQALEGIAQGNNNLIQIGDAALAIGQADGAGNIAFLDQQAYEGYVAGMAELERVKQETWMQYTFRTH